MQKQLASKMATKSTKLQQAEEADAVKQYLLLGFVMKIIDHDIKVIQKSTIKLPRLYETVLRAVQDNVLLDMADYRRQFRQSGIKIYEELQEKDGLLAKYVCRGYHHQIYMLWDFIKVECERVLKQYMTK